MILSATRVPWRRKPLPTPTDLAKAHKHVRLVNDVITLLPAPDYDPKHCNGVTCAHEHRGGSRPQLVSTGRRWIA